MPNIRAIARGTRLIRYNRLPPMDFLMQASDYIRQCLRLRAHVRITLARESATTAATCNSGRTSDHKLEESSDYAGPDGSTANISWRSIKSASSVGVAPLRSPRPQGCSAAQVALGAVLEIAGILVWPKACSSNPASGMTPHLPSSVRARHAMNVHPAGPPEAGPRQLQQARRFPLAALAAPFLCHTSVRRRRPRGGDPAGMRPRSPPRWRCL